MAIFGPNRWWLWGKDAFVSRPPHKNNVFLYDHSNRILYAHEVKAGMRIQPHEELTHEQYVPISDEQATLIALQHDYRIGNHE